MWQYSFTHEYLRKFKRFWPSGLLQGFTLAVHPHLACSQSATYKVWDVQKCSSGWPSMTWYIAAITSDQLHKARQKLCWVNHFSFLKASAWKFEITVHVLPILQFLLHITPNYGLRLLCVAYCWAREMLPFVNPLSKSWHPRKKNGMLQQPPVLFSSLLLKNYLIIVTISIYTVFWSGWQSAESM